MVFCSCACKGTDPEQTKPSGPDEPDVPEPPVVVVEKATSWTTTFDKSRDFAKATIDFGKTSTMSPYAVRFTSDEYQTVDGFGLAVTQASCFNLLNE